MDIVKSIVVATSLAGLGLAGCHSNTEKDKAPATAEVGSKPEEFGSYELCVSYPTPADFHWPKKAVEAFCADEFTAVIQRSEIRKLLEAGQGRKLDAEYDGLLKRYFAGDLPEGSLRYAYHRFDRIDDATGQLIEQWLIQSPDSPHALAARGIWHEARGSEARGSKYIQDTPAEDLARMSVELEAAKTDLKKALDLNDRIMPAYGALIHAARMDGPRALGDWAIGAALRVDPANFYVRVAYQMAQTPQWGGSFEEMDRIAAEAQALVKKNPRLVNLRALALAARGFEDYVDEHYESALPEYERGNAEGPVSFNLHMAGSMSYKLGRKDRAIEYFSQMLRFSPWDTDARVYRARCFTDLGQHDRARTDLEAALREEPEDMHVLRGYARLLMIKKDFKAAAEYLERAQKIDANDEWTTEQLAWIYLYRKRSFKEAEPLVASLLEKNPQSGSAWLMRADLIQNLGGPGLREAAENFVRYADPSNEDQRKALPKVKDWLAKQPKG